ncbi:MAG: hypothetical protein K1X87_12390 [Dehalococcoidia bacterium]|nr:hypothetical protein [Dehalococcoidia bacterium]
MDSFESVIAGMLRRQGYWVWPRFKVLLTKEEKKAIGRPSSPRWEIDLVGYRGSTNEVLAMECKSFLNSTGVTLDSVTNSKSDTRYKLFREPILWDTVSQRLVSQLVQSGACAPDPIVRLGLATGHIRNGRDRLLLKEHFESRGWILWDDHDVARQLRELKTSGYEDEIDAVVAKLIDVGIEVAP